MKLREQIDQLKAREAELRAERDDYRTASEIYARAIHVLTIVNDNLRKELEKHRSSAIRPLTARR